MKTQSLLFAAILALPAVAQDPATNDVLKGLKFGDRAELTLVSGFAIQGKLVPLNTDNTMLEKSSVMPGAPVLDDLAVSYLAQRSMERWPEFPDAEGHRVRPEPKYPSLMLDRIVRWFLDFLDMAITVTFLDVSRGIRGGTRRGGRHPRKSDGPTPPWHLHRWRSGSSELGRKLSIAAVLSIVAGMLGPIIGLNVC